MAEKKKNILLILTDQHRLSAMGCYGDTPCKTPNLDKLAAKSVRFETAYTSCPVCSPARGSVITGLYPHSHGICSNTGNLGCSVHQLYDSPELLSRKLQAAGYRCGYSGKWHLGTMEEVSFGIPQERALPKHFGFEGQNFPGHGNGGYDYPEYKEYLAKNGYSYILKEPDRGKPLITGHAIFAGPKEATIPYFLTQNTLDMLEGYKDLDEPFFFWHNFWGPHAPYNVPQEYYDMYADVSIPPWPNFDWEKQDTHAPYNIKKHPHTAKYDWSDWEDCIRHYYAFTTQIDEEIGRLISFLENNNLMDNTVIIFTADHGESLGSHQGLMDKGWTHFEETQRIPFIIYDPDLPEAKRGQSRTEWASILDVYPTILDYAGIGYDQEKIHGTSLLPVINDHEKDWRDAIMVEFCGVNYVATTAVTLRHGDIKYGWNCNNQDELYDLAKDPYELNNLLEDVNYVEILKDMRFRLRDEMVKYGHPATGMYKKSRIEIYS